MRIISSGVEFESVSNRCILGDPSGGDNNKVVIDGYSQIQVTAKETASSDAKSLINWL